MPFWIILSSLFEMTCSIRLLYFPQENLPCFNRFHCWKVLFNCQTFFPLILCFPLILTFVLPSFGFYTLYTAHVSYKFYIDPIEMQNVGKKITQKGETLDKQSHTYLSTKKFPYFMSETEIIIFVYLSPPHVLMEIPVQSFY